MLHELWSTLYIVLAAYNSDTMASRSRRWKQKEQHVTYLESETRIYVRWVIELRTRVETLPDTKNKITNNVKSIFTTKALRVSYTSAKYLLWEIQEAVTDYPQATALFARWEHPAGSQLRRRIARKGPRKWQNCSCITAEASRTCTSLVPKPRPSAL